MIPSSLQDSMYDYSAQVNNSVKDNETSDAMQKYCKDDSNIVSDFQTSYEFFTHSIKQLILLTHLSQYTGH